MKALGRLSALVPVLAVAALASTSGVAYAGANTPGVIPPSASPDGHTYAEWSAAWWQFDLGMPVHDPLNPSVIIDPQFIGHDPATIDCAFNQHGHVWFLQGASGNGVAHRTCTIPSGKMLFFPIFDSWVDNSNWDGLPPTTLTEAQLRAIIAANIEAITTMSATIDGRPVAGLAPPAAGDYTGPFRALSPVFSYSVTADNWLTEFYAPPGETFSAQTVTGAVADGVYLMLAPLSVGTHTIQWYASGGGFLQDITYTLTVTPGGH